MLDANLKLANGESFRVYLCRCGRIHIESRHQRLSMAVDELHARLVRSTVLQPTATLTKGSVQ